MSLKFDTQKVPGIRISYPPEIPDSNTLILIYSINQTLRPKKIRDKSLDPKKFRGQGVNFQPPKIRRTLPSCIQRVPPRGMGGCGIRIVSELIVVVIGH